MGGYIFQAGDSFSYVPIADLLGYPRTERETSVTTSPTSDVHISSGSEGTIIGHETLSESSRDVVNPSYAGFMKLALLLQQRKTEEIMDKSKANGFARAIACIQMLWFGASLAGRFAEGLTVTKLEMVSSAYILSTILTYFFWMEKPLDVDCPFVVTETSEGSFGTVDLRPCSHELYWTPSE